MEKENKDQITCNGKDFKDLKTSIGDLRTALTELKRITRDDVTELKGNMKILIDELKQSQADFTKEIHEIHMILAQDYVNRNGFFKFSDNMVGTLDKLNDKIDQSCIDIRREIQDENEKTENKIIKMIFWLVGSSIALGGVIVAIFHLFTKIFLGS